MRNENIIFSYASCVCMNECACVMSQKVDPGIDLKPV